MAWLGFVLGACLGVYVVAFVVRGILRFFLSLTDREMSKRRSTYIAIAIATILAFVISGYGLANGGAPDYSDSWAYLVAGGVVFLYERHRLSRREEKAESTA